MDDPSAHPTTLRDQLAEVMDLQEQRPRGTNAAMARQGELLRREIPARLGELLTGHALESTGYNGNGPHAFVPWVRIFPTSRAPKSDDDRYLSYLFSEYRQQAYLALLWGVPDAAQPVDPRPRIDRARRLLGAEDLSTDISLGHAGAARDYERFTVYAVLYDRDALPDEQELTADLVRMAGLLERLDAAETGTATGRPTPRTGSDFTTMARAVYGPRLVPSRRQYEQQARELLNEFAGRMTEGQANELGALFNSGDWGGTFKRNRFSPAFHGASMSTLVHPLALFNDLTDQLWRASEEEALRLLDDILRDTGTFPGAGRLYPTMLLYLRYPERYVVWLKTTHAGLAAATDFTEPNSRTGGTVRYLAYCAAAHRFAAEHGLAPQEIDAVLFEANRAAKAAKNAGADRVGADVRIEDDVTAEEPRIPPTLAEVSERTYLPLEDLEEWAGLLGGRKRQALFYGPPGTGKTYVAQQLAHHLAGGDGEVETVQFHPSFTYEDFLEGLRPDVGHGGTLGYSVRDGVFKAFCDRARGKGGTHVFVIDEINRAELASTLGEAMMLLEYRDRSLVLPYSQKRFSVPPNVVVLATMNTADRSLALVDFALRRRFHAIPLMPSKDVLAGYLAAQEDESEVVLRFFDLVQAHVANLDHAPGHAYWMADDRTAGGMHLVWRYGVRPYLSEYWFEDPARLAALETEIEQLLTEEI